MLIHKAIAGIVGMTLVDDQLLVSDVLCVVFFYCLGAE